MRAILLGVIALGLTCPACATQGPRARTPAAATTFAPPTSTPPDSTPSPSPSPAPVRFAARVSVIDPATARRMAWSWRRGCPVPVEDLRLLAVSYWGFDATPHTGEMVVAATVARDVVSVFRTLFDARFPIRRMDPVDAYHGDDRRSMAADNTSAFNCRSVTGHPGVWSEHSYGTAVDIDPRENPSVAGSEVEPASGARFADRSLRLLGMVVPGGVVDRAFGSIGWGWGGRWSSIQDYQHFSRSGR